MAIQPFVWGRGGQKMTPKDIERSRLEQALMRRDASDTSPVGHWSAALNRALQGYIVGRDGRRADDAETAGRASGQEAIIAALGGGVSAPTSQPMSAIDGTAGGSSFMDSLINSESGGNWGALNNEGYGGRLQFGAARLADAARAGIIPAGIDGAAFSKLPPEQQMAVEQWHFNDIDQQAQRMGLDQFIGQNVGGVPITQDAIRGMAHLGGIGGTAKFLQSGGQYNPADSNGTSLRDYGLRHGGAGQSAPMQSGPSSASLAPLLANEWAMEVGGPVIEALLSQTMQNENAALEQQRRQADPMYQAELEAALLANEAARRPQAPKAPETQVFFDEATGQDYRAQWNPDTMSWDRVGGVKAPTGPLVQNNIGGEKEWDKESAKLWAKRYDGMVGGASNARDMLAMYDLAESAINSGVRTGFGASQEQALRKMAAGLGIGAEDAEKLAGGELLNTVQNRMALMMRNPDGGMGMPGAMSDADRKFLSDSQVGLDRTPEGNRKMLAAFRAMEKRKIEISELADQYITENGMLDQGFNKIVKEYAEANPMFKVDDVPTGAPARINSKSDFDALPSGATFIAPDGTVRRKP